MKTSFDLMKSLNENALPKIKKIRVLSEKENKLNEGAGAGYNITGTIDASTVNSFNVVETTEDKYGTPTYLLDCDISATLEDVTFESYYDGGHVDSAQIQITKLLLVDNHDPEEKGELNNDNIRQSLDETQVKSLIGAGWSHHTFDGNIEFKEENADGSVYSDFYVYGIEYHFIDEELVKFIDLAVQGENIIEEYIVYAEDYDELDRFDSEEEAVEYAKNTSNAVKVEQYSYRYDFGGDIDVNSEYSETVWEKDDFEESEEHDLSKDLLGDEANKRKSEDQKSLEAYLCLANEIKDGKNDIITLDSAKELVKNAYIKAKGYYSFEPEEIDKRIAKDIPELFGELDEEVIPNSFNMKCPKCGSSNYLEIDDGEDEDGTQHIILKCQDCGYEQKDELTESEESIKYNIYLLLGGDGVYNSKLVDTVESLEQAQDRVAELEAENGCGAYYEKVDSNGKPLEESEELKESRTLEQEIERYKEHIDDNTKNHLEKLEKDLLSIDGVEKVEYDLAPYVDNMKSPIILVTHNLNAGQNILKDIIKIIKDNGVEVEMDELEAHDNLFYIVTYHNNWNENKINESVEIIDEQVVSDKLTEVKSQGNVYMLQDNDKYIVGEDYNKEENLIENAEIYENKEEADKDYFSRCEVTRDGKEVDPTEQNLGVEEQPTEEA